MDLVYDLEGNFLYRSLEIPSEDLPITVLAIINQSYPDYVISDFIQLQDWGESIQYEIVLEGLNKKLEIIVAEDGTILCECDDVWTKKIKDKRSKGLSTLRLFCCTKIVKYFVTFEEIL